MDKWGWKNGHILEMQEKQTRWNFGTAKLGESVDGEKTDRQSSQPGIMKEALPTLRAEPYKQEQDWKQTRWGEEDRQAAVDGGFSLRHFETSLS